MKSTWLLHLAFTTAVDASSGGRGDCTAWGELEQPRLAADGYGSQFAQRALLDLPDALGAESGPLATSRGDCSGLEPLAGAKNHPFAVVEATQRSDLLDLAVIEQFLLGVWELCTGTSGTASP